MADYFDLLTKEELEFNRRCENCSTIEELRNMPNGIEPINENGTSIKYKEINMTLDEFQKEYGLIDIKDLKGKIGF